MTSYAHPKGSDTAKRGRFSSDEGESDHAPKRSRLHDADNDDMDVSMFMPPIQKTIVKAEEVLDADLLSVKPEKIENDDEQSILYRIPMFEPTRAIDDDATEWSLSRRLWAALPPRMIMATKMSSRWPRLL